MDDKKFAIILHELINIKADLLVLKDFVNANILTKGNFTEEEKQVFMKSYETLRYDYQTDIIAQLRARYDSSLGSVDDILNQLFSKE